MVALLLAISVLAGLLTPLPAQAAPGDDVWIPTKDDIAGLPDPDWPDVLWRADSRSWAEILEAGGFNPWGQNDNVADHVMDKVKPKDTSYVPTSESQDAAKAFCTGDVCYLYEITPDNDYVNVIKSYKDALLKNGQYDEDLARAFSREDSQWFAKVKSEREWLHEGPLESKRVKTIRTLKQDDQGRWAAEADEDGFDVVQENPDFTEPWDEDPNFSDTVKGKSIPQQGSCYAVGRRIDPSCLSEPGEGEADAIARDRFDGKLDDIDLTLDLDQFLQDDSKLLAPAPNTIDVLDDAGAGGAFEDFTKDLGEGFSDDLDLLGSVSADSDLLAEVGRGLGMAGEIGSEVLPYAGIAATGWALREDAKEGQWGDLVADSIAEGLQVAIVAEPEFVPILEPLLIADLVLKAVLDEVWKLAHPGKAAEDHRKDIDKATAQLEQASEVLGGHWRRERDELLQRHFEKVTAAQVGDSLQTRLLSDVAVIRSFRDAVQREVDVRAAAEVASSTTDNQRMAVRRAALESETTLWQVGRLAVAKRYEQYVAVADALAKPLAHEAWNLNLTTITEQFLDAPEIEKFTRAVTLMPTEAYYGQVWQDWADDPTDVCTREGRRPDTMRSETAPRDDVVRTWLRCEMRDLRDGLEQVILNTEGFAQHIPDDAVVEQNREALVERLQKVFNAVKWPYPSLSSTTLGVHDLNVVASDGGPIDGSHAGSVRWATQPEDHPTPIQVEAGDTLGWRVHLPKELEVSALPTPSEVPGWKQLWKQQGSVVSFTATRTSGGGHDFSDRVMQSLPVRQADGLFRLNPVTVEFVTPARVRTLAPMETRTVGAVDPFAPVQMQPVEVERDASTRVRIGIAAQRSTVDSLARGSMVVRAPEGVRFDPQTSVVGEARQAASDDWKAISSLTVPATVAADELSIELRFGLEGLGLRPGAQLSWLPKASVVRGAEPAPRTVRFEVGAATNLGRTSVTGSVPVIVPEASTLRLVAGDPALVVSGGVGGTAPLTFEASGAIAVLNDIRLGASYPPEQEGGFVVGHFDGKYLLAERRVRGAEAWKPFAAANLVPRWDASRRILSASADGPLRVDLDSGDQIRWSPQVATTDDHVAGPRRFPFTLDALVTGELLHVGAERTIELVLPPNMPATLRQLEPPRLGEGSDSVLQMGVDAARAKTDAGFEARLRAPDGSAFRSAVVTWQSNGATREMSGTLSTDRRELTLADSGFALERRQAGSFLVAIRTGNTSGQGTAPNGTFHVTGGAAFERKSFPMAFDWAPLVISQTAEPSLQPAETGWASIQLSIEGATRCGAAIVLRAPSGTRLGSEILLGSGTRLPGKLSDGGRTLTVSAPTLCTPGSFEVELASDASQQREGPIRDGSIEVSGSMTSPKKAALGYIAEKAPDISVSQRSGATIGQGQVGHVEFAFRNAGRTSPEGTQLTLRSPRTSTFATESVEYRIGDGPWKVVTGRLSGDRRTLVVDAPRFRVPAMGTSTLVARLLNNSAPWDVGLRADGSLVVTGGSAVTHATTSVSFMSVNGPAQIVVTGSREGFIGDARMTRFFADGAWLVRIDQYRITAPKAFEQRHRANIELTATSSGYTKSASSPDSMRQDGVWHDLGLAVRPRGSASSLAGTVTFVFDTPWEPGLCPIIWWACLDPDPKVAVRFGL